MSGDQSLARWTCAECGRQFARTNQQHKCQRVTVEDHLSGRPENVVALYQKFADLVATCGPVELAPVKAQIGFQVKRIFAGVRLTSTGIVGYLDIARQVDSEYFRAVSPYTKRLFVHHFVISDPERLDAEFAGYVREAYSVGLGEHLRNAVR